MNSSIPPIIQFLNNLDLLDEANAPSIDPDAKTSSAILANIFDSGLVSSQEYSAQVSKRFGLPLVDLSALNLSLIPLEHIDFKLVEKNAVLPIYAHGKRLFVATVEPTNTAALDELKFSTGLQITPVQVELEQLTQLITRLQEDQDPGLEGFLGDDEFDLEAVDEGGDGESNESDLELDDAPVVKFVNKLLIEAINKGASDIHIEPFEKELRIRLRIDGILHKLASQPIALAGRVVARVKILARLDIAERRAPQDGRVKLKISKNKAYDFRVNTLPTVWGEKVVMRVLDASAANLDLTTLGFSEDQLKDYINAAKRPYGMILITGPTGSGKTVTLYSALNMLNDPTKNISTVEDPVEIQLPGITQVNINERANLTFSEALRAFLRQDPDILMLGEIRDLETAEIAIKASQTGHMVFSTLHTNDAPSTLTRLLNMGVPAFNVASSVELIVAQRLVRKLCNKCKQPANIPAKALIDFGFDKNEIESLEIFQTSPDGCNNCTSGYKGRSGVFQVMPISEEMKTLIMDGCTEKDIEKQAIKEGVKDLRASGLLKVKQGITSLEEIERVTNV